MRSSPSSEPEPTFFRAPQQTRSRKTLERIAEAALSLIEEGGEESATVGAIVKRAGASVGSFYARFEGKEDLIRYLQDRVWTEARERWDSALEARDWESFELSKLVEGAVGLLLRSFRADFRQRETLGRDRRADVEGARRVFEFHQHILATLTPLFLAHRAEITHPDPEWAVRLGYRFTVGAIREILELEEIVGIVDGAASSEALIPELARSWIGYLGTGSSGDDDSGEGEVDFFDPWG